MQYCYLHSNRLKKTEHHQTFREDKKSILDNDVWVFALSVMPCFMWLHVI